ncbi:hypothetical protein ASPACDRAFT_121286 [Aspergillus aculeatus ATCC 16872]|uniref:Uncharacterized protein n=1 Tax=Aspergillus aculeatus (strain ATCC 16872 / CBS 172.66 / WB 5094) TaxID=690307 RepID=A0A1L9WRB7_ASPA1|nr:uncharacterized protein ASPACDRAFT_121286 [Aspergillus aculeatus ATCC 16872]OJJ98716.1 hypothetical protein ASPACDRAFT_121286 [Aspergillus aculeatus ATCC 16872]
MSASGGLRFIVLVILGRGANEQGLDDDGDAVMGREMTPSTGLSFSVLMIGLCGFEGVSLGDAWPEGELGT